MNKILVDLPEMLETSRLRLQMPKAGFGAELFLAIQEDYNDYVQWLNWNETIPTVETLEEDCRKHHAEFILRDCIRYLIIEKGTNKVVGRCAFPPTQANWLIPQFGVSYFISKSYRGLGFATEAVYAMSQLAFQRLAARKLEIFCDSENGSSIRVSLKLGFELEYTQTGGWPRRDGRLATLQTYSIFSEQNLCEY